MAMSAFGSSPQGAPATTIVESAADHYAVHGALSFATAQQALKGGLVAFAAARGTTLEVDLSDVGASDSAGLAVLIEWLGWARRNGRELRFANVPATLRAIARISELDGLLFGG